MAGGLLLFNTHKHKHHVSSCTWQVAGSINVFGQPGGEVIRRVDVSAEPKLQQEPFELSSAYFWSTVIVLILAILLLWCNRAKHNTESQREGIVARYMIHVKAMDVLQAQVSWWVCSVSEFKPHFCTGAGPSWNCSAQKLILCLLMRIEQECSELESYSLICRWSFEETAVHRRVWVGLFPLTFINSCSLTQ